MKTIKAMASQIAKREGKKSQARIGDIREILGILSDLFYEANESSEVYALSNLVDVLGKNGAKRARKKK